MAKKAVSKPLPKAAAKPVKAVKKGAKIVARAAKVEAKAIKKAVAPAAKKLLGKLPLKGAKAALAKGKPAAKAALAKAKPVVKKAVPAKAKAAIAKVAAGKKAAPVLAKGKGSAKSAPAAKAAKKGAKVLPIKSSKAGAVKPKAAAAPAKHAQKWAKGESLAKKVPGKSPAVVLKKGAAAVLKTGPKSASSGASVSARPGRVTATPTKGSSMPAKSAAADKKKTNVRPLTAEAPVGFRSSKETPEREGTASPESTARPKMKGAATVPSENSSTVESPVKKARPKLKETDMKKLREMLMHERERIIEEMRILDDRSLTANVEEGANQQPGFSLQLADSASDNMQVETDLGIRSIEAEQLVQIDDALRAIEMGDYGICQRCQEAISVERLFARPNAKYCIECLKLLESGKA